MRLARALLLILALVTGQTYACPGSWVLPDGRECPKCPTEVCVTGSPYHCEEETASLSAGDQDCHACCSLKACDDHGQSRVATTLPAPHIVIALIGQDIELPLGFQVEPRTVHIQVESGLPNAPPSRSTSRAPPNQLS